MEEMMKVLKRKSQIMYDMNSIEKYISAGECDKSLQHAWDEYKAQLEEVEEELRLLSNPETKALEEKKIDLMNKIELHNREIHMLERQIKDIDRQLMSIMV